MRKSSRRVMLGLVGAGAIVLKASPAFAGTITTPSQNPFSVPADSGHKPMPFTVVAEGYTPGTLVQLEICDGKSPTAPGWSATLDCDLGSATAQAVVEDDGTVTFDANDPNHSVQVFRGESPQSLFNCNAPGEANPNNGLTGYTNCQVRVATNMTAATADQAFLTMTLPKSK